jgi:diamine N-acetyltransferase
MVNMISTRRATPADAQLLGELNRDVQDLHHKAMPWLFKPSAAEQFSQDYFSGILAQSENWVVLALVDEVVVGYIYYGIREIAETALTYADASIYIHQISVKPALHKRGIGRALMAEVDGTASELGIEMVQVDFWAFNDEAREFYKHLGYSRYNERWWKLSR